MLDAFASIHEAHNSEEIEGVLGQRLKSYKQFLKPSTVARLIEMYNNRKLGNFYLPEIQETDDLIEAYNRGKVCPDLFLSKPLADDSTIHSENS